MNFVGDVGAVAGAIGSPSGEHGQALFHDLVVVVVAVAGNVTGLIAAAQHIAPAIKVLRDVRIQRTGILRQRGGDAGKWRQTLNRGAAK